MAKSSKEKGDDPYLDNSSGCFYNLLGVLDQKTLGQLEADFVTIRTWELEHSPINKSFDLEHLKAIHKHLFQDVYAWAGQLRCVNISKGDTFFLPHSRIDPGSHYIFNKLKEENFLKGPTGMLE